MYLYFKDILEAPIIENMFKIAFNDKFVFNQWLPALRNGSYKQGSGYLHVVDSFCCLGVGCDLMDPGRPLVGSKWEMNDGSRPGMELFRFRGGAIYSSQEFADFVGFRKDSSGSFTIAVGRAKDEIKLALDVLNDGGFIYEENGNYKVELLSFTQIADVIEAHAKAAMKLRGRS